jgi:hypothetical protein
MDLLFGDLPAAKNSSNKGEDDLFGGLPTAVSETAGETRSGKPIADVKIILGADGSTAVSSEKRTSATSLVSAVGKAGTSLAFVPQAISQARKKKKSSSQQSTRKVDVDVPKQTIEIADEEGNESIVTAAKYGGSSRMLSSVDATYESMHKSTVACHNSTTARNDNGDTNNEQSYEEPYLENEPESIQMLHDSVTPANAYNPHFPNDYLAHLERKKTERIQKELQQSALQRLDQQEKLRKKIEEERRKIESSGDVNKIVESRMGGSDAVAAGVGGVTAHAMGGAGRGRGRGVQNLPSWLIKKQQEEQKEADETLPSNASAVQDQFGDAEGEIKPK